MRTMKCLGAVVYDSRLVDEGNDVRVVFFTNGVGARKSAACGCY